MAKQLPRRCHIVGIDRHGRAVASEAELTSAGETARLAYVGTAAACGAFAGDTMLIASDGKKRRVNDIVESGDISRVHFESLVRLPELVETKLASRDLWPTLRHSAAIGTDEYLTLRCRDPIHAFGIQRRFPKTKQIADQAFVELHRREFDMALSSDWPEAITGLVTCWLMNGGDERVEVERCAYDLAVWLAAARTESGAGYQFQYDTLQHSSYVFVRLSENLPRPVQQGACAFYTPHDTQRLTLRWRGSSRAPILAGFLLAST